MLETDKHIRDNSRTAMRAIALFSGATLFWGGLVPIGGAVVSTGIVAVDGNVKKVQHATGGVVGQILVKEGSRVKQGDVVARLDDTQTRANLGIITAELVALSARTTRLTAERDDAKELLFTPSVLTAAEKDALVRQAVDSEAKLFHARRTARETQKSQLRERIEQTSKDIESAELQLRSSNELLAIATSERQDIEPLRLKGLALKSRVTQLDREISQRTGSAGDAKARIEQGRAKIRETELQIQQVDRDRISEVSKDLRDAEARIAELSERRKVGDDLLQRVDIRAPVSGYVHEMTTHTVGGVINPAEALMLIVPDDQPLVVEARVAPPDIDQVHHNQPARIRFTSFNQRITPEVQGTVFRISPNSSRDQQTGALYFTVGLKIAADAKEQLNGAALMPGMLADTFISTTDRTVLSFLFKPLTDNFYKIFTVR